jgi:uncharacterized membrane protein
MGHALLLALHIASVAGWLGANYVQLVLVTRFERDGRDAALAWTRQSNWLGERYYNVVGALIAITGVLLVLTTPWSWGDPFVWVGLTVIVVGAVIGLSVFGPVGKRRQKALEDGDNAAAAATLRTIVGFSVFDTGLVLLAVVAMVSKWMA